MAPQAAEKVPALTVRLRPCGPWRIGPDTGARDGVASICHSDTLYAAVCWAMGRLGELPAWLEATAARQEGAQVRFSSCFPFQGELLYVVPPRSLWPPPPSTKVRWKGARFVPLSLVEVLLREQPLDEERWSVDGDSECLIPARGLTGRGPFRPTMRSSAAVDRCGAGVEVHKSACLEFAAGAGLWCVAAFADQQARERWGEPVRAAFRLLADSGIGGRRSAGWGRSEAPEFEEGELPDLIVRPLEAPPENPEEPPPAPAPETAWWLLSLFTPAEQDGMDWQRGSYTLTVRGGRIESPVRPGVGKCLLRMVEEGSVVFAGRAPVGAAADVAPEGFPHPVYRAGFAVAVPIPWRVIQ